MRFPKPFFRKSKQAWYLQLGRHQISLGKNRSEAFKRYQEVLLRERGQIAATQGPGLTAAQVCDLFLDWCGRHNEPTTCDFYKMFLQDFCDLYGGLHALEVKPFDLTQWLERHDGWRDGTRRCAITAVKRVFNWAEFEGLLPTNPIKRVRKPKARNRDRILTVAEKNDLLDSIKDQEFKDFVFALLETGCRPELVARVSADSVNLDESVWEFAKHKTVKKTGRPLTVYLTPAMTELTRRLMEKYPSGPLFRSKRSGKAFSRNAIRCRFRRLRKKLPRLKGVVAYTCRHTFVTDALENGVGIVQVAELVGHTNTDMVMRHYQHLSQKRAHLRQAVIQATRPKPA